MRKNKVLFLLACIFTVFSLTACEIDLPEIPGLPDKVEIPVELPEIELPEIELPDFVENILGIESNDKVEDNTNDDVVPHTHEYTWTVKEHAKCDVEGIEIGTCTCGESISRTVEPTGHVFVKDPAVAATCTTTGLTEGEHCEKCGFVSVMPESTPVRHEEVTVPGTAATCTEPGSTDSVYCSLCETVLVEAEEIPAGHTAEEIPAVAATCTIPGLTAGSKCSVCGEVLVAQEETPLADHSAEELPAVAATCTTTGLTAGSKCSVCGEVLVEQEVAPLAAHTFENVFATAPTCATTGNVAHRHCSTCGLNVAYDGSINLKYDSYYQWAGSGSKLFTRTGDGTTGRFEYAFGGNWFVFLVLDSEGRIAYLIQNPANGYGDANNEWYVRHSIYADYTTNPAFANLGGAIDQWGNIGFDLVVPTGGFAVMVNAGEVLLEEIFGWSGNDSAYSHKSLNVDNIRITIDGYDNLFIMHLDRELVEIEDVVVPVSDHTAEEVPAVDATCAAPGLTAGSKCSVCGEVLEAQEETEKLEHTPGAEATWASAQTCTVCGEVLVEKVTSVTFYYYNSNNWSTINLYAWTDTSDYVVAWPGTAMTAVPELGDNWYSSVVTTTSLVGLNVIFNNKVGDVGEQTANIAVVEGNYYYYGMKTTGYATKTDVEEAIAKDQEQPQPEGITLYLKPNDNWVQGNAWFAVYYWDSTGNHWAKMFDTDGDDVYEAVVPEGTQNVIFCRMNSGKTDLDWNSRWDQTINLQYTSPNNLFTVNSGDWNNANGTWTTK